MFYKGFLNNIFNHITHLSHNIVVFYFIQHIIMDFYLFLIIFNTKTLQYYYNYVKNMSKTIKTHI